MWSARAAPSRPYRPKHAYVARAARPQRARAGANAIPGTGVPPPAGCSDLVPHASHPSADAVPCPHRQPLLAGAVGFFGENAKFWVGVLLEYTVVDTDRVVLALFIGNHDDAAAYARKKVTSFLSHILTNFAKLRC
jgi:hypothetical protein